LNNVQDLKGKCVSVTTDGFITDIENLEELIINKTQDKFSLFKEFKKMRKTMSGNDIGLELKHEGKGIIS
jgi:hypothetical protein